MNIREKIIHKVLEQLNLLLIDYNLPGANQDYTRFGASQFAHLYPDAYNEKTRVSSEYPLSDDEIIILEQARLVKSVKIGFIPVARLTEEMCPALFITSATDTFNTEVVVQGVSRNAELYPINLRLVLREPDDATQDTANVVIAARLREGLGYVLDFNHFYNLSAERFGYNEKSRVENITIAAGQNLEEFATPWEVIDYRIEVVFTEQKSLGSNRS